MPNFLAAIGSMIVLALVMSAGAWAQSQEPAWSHDNTQRTPLRHDEAGNEESDLVDRTEKRELREERMNIRTEHERLETERERLKSQCMDAKGQERTTCEQGKAQLRQQFDALHERVKNLHEKVASEQARAAPQGAVHPYHPLGTPAAKN